MTIKLLADVVFQVRPVIIKKVRKKYPEPKTVITLTLIPQLFS